jgi:hypothetical protein
MKWITVFFLLTSIIYGQEFAFPQYRLDIKLSSPTFNTAESFVENAAGNICGLIIINDDNSFLLKHTSSNYNYDDNPAGPYLVSNKIKKLIQFNFSINRNSSTDKNIKLKCEYYIYEKKESTEINNYGVSQKEILENIPLDKELSLNFLSSVFTQVQHTVILKVDRNASKRQQIAEGMRAPGLSFNGHLSWAIKDIKNSIKKSTLKNKSFKMDLGFLITDKSGKEIDFRKFEYPLPSDTIYSLDSAAITSPVRVYFGKMKKPFAVYNPKIVNLYRYSEEYKNSQIEEEIALIPIGLTANTVSFELFWGRHVWYSTSVFTKKFKIELGKPLKLEMDGFGTGITRMTNANGESFQIGLNDYSDYINEYLIITVYDDKK